MILWGLVNYEYTRSFFLSVAQLGRAGGLEPSEVQILSPRRAGIQLEKVAACKAAASA